MKIHISLIVAWPQPAQVVGWLENHSLDDMVTVRP
jgi:hypothetical protein